MKYRSYLLSSMVVMSSAFVSLAMRLDANGCPLELPYTSEMAHFDGICYRFVSEEKYWPDARDHCLRTSGRLVKIDDPETNDFIVEKLNALSWRNNGVWIGLHDIPVELHWQWTGYELYQNEPVLWTNWGRGHPKAFFHSRRDCIRMVRNDGWKWHETFCNLPNWKYRFICEYRANQSAVNGGHSGGQSSRNRLGSIDRANLLGSFHSDSFSSDDDSRPAVRGAVDSPQSAAAARLDAAITSDEKGHSQSAGIVVAIVCVLAGTLVLVGLFMVYRRRRRRERQVYSSENCVGSKGKKFDDVMTEASSFRPFAVSNVYVETDAKGRVKTRPATSAAGPTGPAPGESDSADEETDSDRSMDKDSLAEIDEDNGGEMVDASNNYDRPRAVNIYSEIPDADEGEIPDHIYEALEDIRR